METQKKLGLSIKQSNLCSEITLPTDEDRTAVCCLSSVNLAKYDEWSTSSTFIPDMVRMLDNVLEHFIQATYDFSYDYKGEEETVQPQGIEDTVEDETVVQMTPEEEAECDACAI